MFAEQQLCTCSCFDLRDSVSWRELSERSSVETKQLTNRHRFIRAASIANPKGVIGGIVSLSHANFQLAV